METVIKQAEENRNRSVGIANRVHEEYLPLKHEIDHMRREYLGLNPLPDLHEEEGSTISAEYVFHCLHKMFLYFALRSQSNAIVKKICFIFIADSSQHTIEQPRVPAVRALRIVQISWTPIQRHQPHSLDQQSHLIMVSIPLFAQILL